MFALEKKAIGLNTLPQLKILCKMLRNNADKILVGEMSVTITSEVLQQLNEAADNLQNGLPPALSADSAHSSKAFSAAEEEEWNYLLQLVLDIVTKAPVLVLHRQSSFGRKTNTTTSGSESLPVPVRLGCFLGLTHLEISHVSLGSIQDLLKLRDQLVTLVIINCFSPKFHLQDVLEMCDTQVSVPLQWSSLKMLCLRFNNLIELDGSLRLCPALEYVDLSGNHLTATEGYLGYLMELRHVDLSYNNLVMLPSFSATAKKKLQVLILAGNRISSLNGLEEMTSLEELDISENLIASHFVLHPIRLLHRLDKLNLKGCPAVLKKGHRVMTLQYISTVALSRKFSLDGKLVKHKEIQISRAVMSTNTVIIRPSPASPVASVCPENNSRVPTSSTELPGGQQQGPLEDSSVSVTLSKKKKTRKKKARTMDDIPDMDTSTGGELSSKDVTPSTTPKFASRLDAVGQLRRQELENENTKIQHIRRYYGESWLQVIEDQGLLPRPASISAALSERASATSDVGRVNVKKDEPNDNRSDTKSGHDGQTQPPVDRAISPNNVENDKSFSTKESQLVVCQQDPSTVEKSGAKLSTECAPKKDAIFYVSEEDSDVPDIISSNSLKSRRFSHDQSCRTELTELEDSTAVQKIRERVGDGSVNVNGTSIGKDLSPDMIRGSGEIHEEPEEQSEPFFVTLPSGDHVILTVTKRYLVEKDINLAVLDQLDLQCLESIKLNGKTGVQKDKMDSEAGNEHEVHVYLYFSHIRKDRKCRVYVMEDFITAQHFSEQMHPYIDAKVQVTKKMMQAQHQCLKCSHIFTRAQAKSEVLTPSIPHVGSVRDFKGTDFKEEKVVLKCPKCDSDHVVLLDLDNSQHKEMASSLTLTEAKSGSFGRRQSLGQITLPLSPKAHSTPLKDHVSASEIYVTENQPKVARISTWKDLFVTDGPTADQRQTGDGPRVKSPLSQPIESKFHSALKQQEQDHLSHEDADTLSALSVSAISGKDVLHNATAADRVDSSGKEQADSSVDGGGLSDSTLHDLTHLEHDLNDLTHLEHDLKLHLMMHIFDNNEDFKFKVKTTICQYMVFEEYEGLVVVTNLKLYILQISKVDSSRGHMSMEGLKLMEAQPHAELRRVDLGLGQQTLRLEFLSDCSSYTLVLRDADKLELFKELLMENLETFSRSMEMPMLAIFNEDVDQQTIDNLDADVLSKSGLRDALRLYALGYIVRGHNAMFPVAYVVSTSEICLVRTNHQWPSPKHQAPLNSEIVTKQFTVLERQKINNIATVEVHTEHKNKLCITFFNESSGDEAQWLVTMDAVKGIQSIIFAIKGPWEDEFGIELEVTQSEFESFN